MNSSLLRVSDFCRSSHHQQRRRIPVNLSLMNTKGNVNKTKTTDTSFICYVGVETLASLAVHEHSLALLCLDASFARRVVVRLVLLDEEEDDSDSAVVMVSPITVINLGLLVSSDSLDACCWLETVTKETKIAQSVKLRPLGNQCDSWPHLFSSKEKEEEWILPPSNTLLQTSNLFSVYHDKRKRVSYYEILEILSEEQNSTPDNNCNQERSTASSHYDIYLTSSSTKFELDGSFLPPLIRKLPPLVLQRNFHRQGGESIPPHPNLLNLIQALNCQDVVDSREKIIHLVGNHMEHRVGLLVKAAAQQVGMQCLSIRGLTAFAHHQGLTVRTGSLTEQLGGLRAAFQLIRTQRMEPCVLFLQDIDSELSSTDEPVRHEQEERFWAQWILALSLATTSATIHIHNKEVDAQQLLYTPPVLIVISTCSALKPGPWMENMVYPSIVLDTPDKKFSKYLWESKNGNVWDDAFWDNKLLMERTAQDIEWLCQQLSLDTAIRRDSSSIIKQLECLCQELDVKRRQQSSPAALVSNVHWEDVGGLSHVRREILDTIELPLKYPSLFPSSSKRSGILLYGPPGTGKTLVAKAVATECGLPFFSVKGPELLGSYVGESEAAVRAIFQSARDAAAKNAPIAASILFFDELDSLAPRRGGVGDGGGVMERVLATLFAELDGNDYNDYGRVFCMGATNRPDLLDPSLLRPGRLDRLVYLGVPTDKEERARILAAQIRKLRLKSNDPLELAMRVVSELPPRLTGADLSAVASGALSHAVQRLCRKADEELQKVSVENKGISMEQVLEGWHIEQRTPTVELEDLLEASKEVSPTLSQSELERYERLRQQYSSLDDSSIS